MVRIVAREGKPAPKYIWLHEDSGRMFTKDDVKIPSPHNMAVTDIRASEETDSVRSCFNKSSVVEADLHRKCI